MTCYSENLLDQLGKPILFFCKHSALAQLTGNTGQSQVARRIGGYNAAPCSLLLFAARKLI